jgi:outer membrane receptor for ferrienterochelin and colicins
MGGGWTWRLTVAALVGALSARAEEPPSPPPPLVEYSDLSLEELLEVVLTASKRAERIELAPAIIDVISAEQIAARGYLTVAEAVADVAGIYVVNDQYQPSVAVRGVEAGLRSWTRIVKVLIDGQPVPFRPEGTHWTGLELLPLSAIRQIEVLRGPASALFGADAYLGVINILTRAPGAMKGGRVQVRGHAINGRPGVSAEAVASGEAGSLRGMLAVAAARLDRSGLSVSPTYPNFKPESFQDAAGNLRVTRSDLSLPLSAYGRVEREGSYGTLGVAAHFQRLRSGANFQDFASVPEQGTVMAQHNLFARGYFNSPSAQRHGFSASLGFAEGGYDPADRLEVNDPSAFYSRLGSYRAIDARAEYNFAPTEEASLKLGLDLTQEWHRLLDFALHATADRGDLMAGQVAEPAARFREFPSGGLFAQGTLPLLGPLRVTAGARLDTYRGHTRWVWVPSGRLGVVYPWSEHSSVKVLYGRSFKAPPAAFRYALAGVVSAAMIGNDQLGPETADTFEVGTRWVPIEGLSVDLALFHTRIVDLTEFVENGGAFTARNRQTATSTGGELELGWKVPFGQLSAQYAVAYASRPYDASGQFAARGDELTGVSQLPRYPPHQLKVTATLPWERAHLALALTAGWVSARRATDFNIRLNNRFVYTAPAYFPVDAALSSTGLRPLPFGETRLQLRVQDLLNQKSPEPGYTADLPALGRQFTFSVSQDW